MMKRAIHNDLKADMLDNAPVITAFLDMDHNILWANKAFQEAAGLSLQEMEGKECHLIWGFDEPCHNCPVKKAIETGELCEAEITPRNQEQWIDNQGSWLVRATPTRNKNGSIIGSIMVAYDITDRKQVEESLRENEEQLNTLIDAMPDFICFKDGDGRWLKVNDAAIHIFQLENVDYRGKKDSELGELNSRLQGAFLTCKKSDAIAWNEKRLFSGEEIISQPDGTVRNYDVTKIPIFHSDGRRKGIVVIGNDITNRKKAEKDKAQIEEQYRQSQKMESVGRLAGGVAHDFNNMLGVILGYTEMLQDKLNPDQPAYAYLQEIHKAAKRSADLTRQLLAFARRQTVSPRVLELNETVEGMHKMLLRLIGEDIDLAWLPGTDIWSIMMDPVQIDQILANLCVNGRDAIAGIGKMTIETKNVVLNKSYCKKYPGSIPGDYVLLTVSDDGCGMDNGTMENIFEPFFTTKEMGRGTGLGLATVYGIVKQNNGFIYVHSELDKGTTFNVYLPRHMEKITTIQKKTPTESVKHGYETILLVEDEPAILEMATTMLEMQGYTVLAVTIPSEAIRMAREYDSEIHLLMTDLVMPEMNGRDLAKKLTSLRPNIKYLFMSGYTDNIIAHRCVLDKGIDFIQKPFTLQDLFTSVREVLDSK
jgi:PAS domain S-box-containing protein